MTTTNNIILIITAAGCDRQHLGTALCVFSVSKI